MSEGDKFIRAQFNVSARLAFGEVTSRLLPDLFRQRVASERTLYCQKIGELKSIVRRNPGPISEGEGDCCWHPGSLFDGLCRRARPTRRYAVGSTV